MKNTAGHCTVAIAQTRVFLASKKIVGDQFFAKRIKQREKKMYMFEFQ